ncbi:MAG: hypothetical protein M1423_04160 [Acidobacteria bacterium]|nr:hypothetical protein [Acidobacteriota bacterium]
MPKPSGLFHFFTHSCFGHPFSLRPLVIAGFMPAVFLSAVASLAQQGRLPQATEPANIVRLRQEWFYQQRAKRNSGKSFSSPSRPIISPQSSAWPVHQRGCFGELNPLVGNAPRYTLAVIT